MTVPPESGGPASIHVLAFAGSLRSGSYNRALLRAAVELAPDGVTIDIVPLDDIPFYDRDVEREGDPEPVVELKQAIDAADALLIATPEYQHSIPGVLKNALDWASRPHRRSVLIGKPAAIMGAAPGRFGTARGQDALREVLAYNQCFVLPRPGVLVGNARDKFDDDLRLVDESTRERVAKLLTHLKAWARHMNAWEPPSG